MNKEHIFKPIAYIESDFDDKFGIPRQSGLVSELKAKIIFVPEYRNIDAVRGLESFSHIWLIWQFSKAVRDNWSPTVRPPRLGGNVRQGVFATRSPFRPNAIGLSSVKLDKVDLSCTDAPVLTVSGADLLNGTPIYDIKPYIPMYDSHEDATETFTAVNADYTLSVNADEAVLSSFPVEKRAALINVLAQDPRPSYQNDADRVYAMSFAGFDVRFTVDGKELTVLEIKKK